MKEGTVVNFTLNGVTQSRGKYRKLGGANWQEGWVM